MQIFLTVLFAIVVIQKQITKKERKKERKKKERNVATRQTDEQESWRDREIGSLDRNKDDRINKAKEPNKYKTR